MSSDDNKKIEKTDDEWKQELTTDAYKVLRGKGTEPPFSGAHLLNKDKGTYLCGGCNIELFSSETKFDSGSGWPSFWDPVSQENIETSEDRSLWNKRIEVKCERCGGHLGHVFRDGPDPTGKRYCINSAALKFKKEE